MANQQAVRMAGKDLDAAQQYLRLALSTTHHAVRILSEEAVNDIDLEYPRDQAKALANEIARAGDAAGGIDAPGLKDYSEPRTALQSFGDAGELREVRCG